jgi:hypothetical protein
VDKKLFKYAIAAFFLWALIHWVSTRAKQTAPIAPGV